MAQTTENSARTQRPRWRLLGALALLGATAIVVAWLWPAESRQQQVMRSGMAAVAAFALLCLWVLFASKLRLGVRCGVVATVAATGLLVYSTVRVVGVSGDLVPVLGWRYARTTAPAAPPPSTGNTVPSPNSVSPPRWLATTTDYPQFLGRHRDGEVAGVELAKNWEARPPRELWRKPVGEGWSSFAIVGELAFTQEQRGDSECVVCYTLASGKEVWVHGDLTRYENLIAGIGPRATPTVAAGTVFSLGATGRLNALDATNGTPKWQRDVIADDETKTPEWGVSSSPLIHGGRLLVHVNGRLVAYDPETGERLWRTDADRWGYASPVVATLAGVEQVVSFQGRRVSGHDPSSGATLWSHPWDTHHPTASQPRATGPTRLFVSSGYGTGCELLDIRADADGALAVTSVWKTKRLKAKFTNVIVRGEFAYGLDDGVLVCLDLKSGERRWKSGRYGHGQTLGVGSLLLIQAESGDVVLLEANPGASRKLGRLHALNEKTWNHAVLAGNRLLVRNDREAACFELPLAGAEKGRP